MRLVETPIAGQFVAPGRTLVAHYGDWDTLLVRAGHRLWRWHKQAPDDKALIAAIEDMWRVKREYRADRLDSKRAAMIERAKTLRRSAA